MLRLKLGLLAGVFLGIVAADSTFAAQKYPPGFDWGSAFSAHQTEGKTGGAENGDWWEFEHSLVNGRSPIANGDTTELATDHWRRYDEDFAHAQKMGLDSVRISLAWEKIEPSPGEFSSEALAHYKDVLRSMRARGLKPVVAFHHFTHPLWFHAQGGWTAEESPRIFLRYASRVVKELSELCDTWITFNEPMVLVWLGYVQGSYPPNHRSIDEGVQVAVNLARAHRLVAAAIHEAQPLPPVSQGYRGVGLVNSLQLYEPLRAWNPAEKLAASVIDAVSNWAFPGLALDGELPVSDRILIALAGGPLRLSFPKDEAQGNPGTDWFGINYYTRYFVQGQFPVKFGVSNPKDPTADNGWGIYPEGLETIIHKTARRIHLPLVVSENGLADAEDRNRPRALRESLEAIDRVVGQVDLRGYVHWSLTDNFEWLWGYQYRFGLIAIEPGTLARKPRPSAQIYTQEIEARK